MEEVSGETVAIGIVGEGVLVDLLINTFINTDVSLNILEKYQTEAMIEAGACCHQSIVSFSRISSVIITVMPDGPALEKILFDQDGILNFCSTDKVVVDMSAVSPELIQELSEQCVEREMMFLDAAIINEGKTQSGMIQIMMFGGDGHAFEKVQPIFQMIAEDVKHIGANGASQFYRQAFGVRKKQQ